LRKTLSKILGLSKADNYVVKRDGEPEIWTFHLAYEATKHDEGSGHSVDVTRQIN